MLIILTVRIPLTPPHSLNSRFNKDIKEIATQSQEVGISVSTKLELKLNKTQTTIPTYQTKEG